MDARCLGCLLPGVRLADDGEPRYSGVGSVALSDVATIVSAPAFVSQVNKHRCIRSLPPHNICVNYYVHIKVVWGFSLAHPRERSRSNVCCCSCCNHQGIGNLATQPSPGRDIFAVVRSLPRKPRTQSVVQALTKVLEPRPNHCKRCGSTDAREPQGDGPLSFAKLKPRTQAPSSCRWPPLHLPP